MVIYCTVNEVLHKSVRCGLVVTHLIAKQMVPSSSPPPNGRKVDQLAWPAA